jgi:subtilisin-like proprotein convertase family protein
VYAAPTVQTTYTVTATDVATGCINTASVLVNYTPPPPTVTPNPVAMCLGDAAVKLKASSSQAFSNTFNSGTVNVTIPDGPAIPPVPTSYPASVSNITVSGIPAGATITGVRARLNITHAYVGDCVIALKAPNGQIFNLDAMLNRTNNPGANFTNTVISSAGTTLLSAGTAPFTNTYKADAAGATFTAFGFTFPGGPVGYVPTTTNYSDLYTTGTPNGVWSIGIYDAGAPDAGVLNNWSLDIDYTVGVVATAALWSPAAGLFSDANATVPYVLGTRVDSVWTRPTPAGVYNYQVTVNNILNIAGTTTTPMAGGNGNFLVAYNVRNNNPYAITLTGVSSNVFTSGANVTSRVFYKTTPIAGNPGPISAANGWTQFGTTTVATVTAGALNPVITGTTLSIPSGATYGIALDMSDPTASITPAYTNGTGTVQTYSSAGVDIITDGNVGWGGPAAPGTPANNPRNFNGAVTFLGSGPGTCQSPPRTVVVTVNQPTVLNAQLPANQTICTDKVATFTVAVTSGTGPHNYQWQVSTNNGGSWTNITDGGVYSGATTATLTITAPPVTMSGYQYRAIVNGAAPCASQTSRAATLTVNPLPVIVISASATSLLPGMTSTLTSTVTPNPAATYSWIRNGSVLTASSTGVVSGIGTGTLKVDVDGQGDYQLRVNDVNGCTSISNTITIRDSASGRCYIYPNPTSGIFQVRYYSAANNVLPRSLTIYDSKGDRVMTKFYTIGRPYDRMDVDMRAMGKGLYWVEIGDLNGNRLTMCRVVIQ